MTDKSNDNKGSPPDIDALAREYLQLWQKQLSATTNDETLTKSMSDAMRLMTAGAAQMAAMTAPNAGKGASDDIRGSSDASSGVSSGAATSPVAHRDDDGVLDKLNRRVAALEERITILESEAEARRRKSRDGPR